MLRTTSLALLSCLLLAVTSACGSDSPRTLNIAFIPKNNSNPVFLTAHDGAVERALELTQAGPNKVNLVYLAPTAVDPNLEIEQMQIAIDQKVDGIALSCVNTAALTPVINQAVAAGIKVMTWDSDCPGSDRFTYLGMNRPQSGIDSAKILAKLMGETGYVASIGTTSGSANILAGLAAFNQEIATNHPNIKIIGNPNNFGIDPNFNVNNDPNWGNDPNFNCNALSNCATAVEYIVTNYPQVTGIHMPNTTALFNTDPNAVYPTLTSMPNWTKAALNGNIFTVGVDSLPVELVLLQNPNLPQNQNLVQNGNGVPPVQALMGQKYWTHGYESISLLHDMILTGKYNGAVPGQYTDTGRDLVCANNVAVMQQEWASSNFPDVLSPACSLFP